MSLGVWVCVCLRSNVGSHSFVLHVCVYVYSNSCVCVRARVCMHVVLRHDCEENPSVGNSQFPPPPHTNAHTHVSKAHTFELPPTRLVLVSLIRSLHMSALISSSAYIQPPCLSVALALYLALVYVCVCTCAHIHTCIHISMLKYLGDVVEVLDEGTEGVAVS
jgi:hypothetical protein